MPGVGSVKLRWKISISGTTKKTVMTSTAGKSKVSERQSPGARFLEPPAACVVSSETAVGELDINYPPVTQVCHADSRSV